MYTTDLITLPRFCFGRGVYSRFPALCRPMGRRFAVVGGVTGMSKGLPSLTAALADTDMELLAALPFGGACTQSAMDTLCEELAPMKPDFLIGMGGIVGCLTGIVARRVFMALKALPDGGSRRKQ